MRLGTTPWAGGMTLSAKEKGSPVQVRRREHQRGLDPHVIGCQKCQSNSLAALCRFPSSVLRP
jgi:hypothetical protein